MKHQHDLIKITAFFLIMALLALGVPCFFCNQEGIDVPLFDCAKTQAAEKDVAEKDAAEKGAAEKKTGASEPDPDFHIYLAFGQSNMTGVGEIGEQDRDCDEDYLVMCTTDNFHSPYNPEIRAMGHWYRATPPLAGPFVAKLSVADYFGRKLLEEKKKKDPHIRVGIMVVAVPGCGIRLFDKDACQAYVQGLPMITRSGISSYMQAYGGSPYQRLVECGRLAQKKGVIKGIIMHQGETDFQVPGWKEEVEKIYHDLVKDLDLPEDTPFVAGEVRKGTRVSGMDKEINRLPSVNENFYVVSTDHLTDTVVNPGDLHFSPEEYRELGRRYALKMLEAEKNSSAPAEIDPSSIVIRDSQNEDVGDSTLEMKGGEKEFLSVSITGEKDNVQGSVSWMSDNKNVTVKNGMITAAEVTEEMTADITVLVRAVDGGTGKKGGTANRTIRVHVTPVIAEKIASRDKSHVLKLRKSLKITTSQGRAELPISILPRKGTDLSDVRLVSVQAGNPDVVSVERISDVSVKGREGSAMVLLTAKAPGKTFITVKTTSGDGKEVNIRRCHVTVARPAEKIVIKSGTLKVSDKNTITMKKGESGTVRISLLPEDSTDMDNLRIRGSGGISVENGVIYAKRATSTGKQAKLMIRCGSLREVVWIRIVK